MTSSAAELRARMVEYRTIAPRRPDALAIPGDEPLSQPLPAIPLPLRDHDGEARLDLQQVLNRVFDGAGYDYYIYENAPEPPLTPEQAGWASQFVSK
jgi:hypothetical protein